MSVYDFSVKDSALNNIPLKNYKGKVLLIVNVASKCGFTYQYEGLQNLYEKFNDRGLEILAFPCNQFNKQEPGNNSEIAKFCNDRFGVTFKIFNKIEINGPNADPFYSYIKNQKRGFFFRKDVIWNFSKFLINRNGEVIKRYGPTVKPERIEKKLKSLI